MHVVFVQEVAMFLSILDCILITRIPRRWVVVGVWRERRRELHAPCKASLGPKVARRTRRDGCGSGRWLGGSWVDERSFGLLMD